MKKISVIILILLMFLGITPIYAEEVINVSIPVEVIGGGTVKIDGKDYMPSNTTLKVEETGVFELSLVNPEVGHVYEYQVSQVKGNEDIIYDETVFDVHVYILYGKDNETLIPTIVISKGNNPEKQNSICFKNTDYERGNVLVEHRDEDTGELLAVTVYVIKNGKIGEKYTTSVGKFDGYTFTKMDSKSAPAVGEVMKEDQLVIYLYSKKKATPTPSPTSTPTSSPVSTQTPDPINRAREYIQTGTSYKLLYSMGGITIASILLLILKRKENK